MFDQPAHPAEGDRLAKVIARSGLCSRRDAEGWIRDGRVTVNGKKVVTPAFNVAKGDRIKVDGEPLAAQEGTRVWLYHKPAGLVVTEKDPEGRETIFERLAEHGLPRVVTIGRLDINTEGLLLLTNDGGLKRILELPATGWLRRYRVRAHGSITQAELDRLKSGVEIDGIKYGPIEAVLERSQGSNVWLVVSLREGKNREVKNVLGSLGLQVNRLIRVSFGPFQLGDLPEGQVEVVKARVLREQLGKRLADAAGADFDSDLPELAAQKRAANPKLRAAPPGKAVSQAGARKPAAKRFRFEDDEVRAPAEPPPRRDRPGRPETKFAPTPARSAPETAVPPRKIHFSDGREPAEFKAKAFGKKPGRGDADRPSADTAERRPAGGGQARDASHHRPSGGFRGGSPGRPGNDRPRNDRPPERADVDRPYGGRPAGAVGPKRGFSERSPRSPGDKPYRPREPGAAARPTRGGPPPFGKDADRPARNTAAKPYQPRGASAPGRPPRGEGDGVRSGFGSKPRSDSGTRSAPARSGKTPNLSPREQGERTRIRPDGKPAPKRYGAAPRTGRPGGAGKPRGPRKPQR